MPLAFLAPLFFAGLALLVAPWLIHQIRRPERETTRFSSLMFIPQTRKEVIERRRLQHILLMLLRMAMLAFLAAAFARPYLKTRAQAASGALGAAWHLILLDTSYSMGTKDCFEKARAKARAIVASLDAADRVGVIAFSRAPETIAPLTAADDPAAGSAASARQAIEAAQLTEDATAYLPALQAAQAMFGSAEAQSGGAPARWVIHLVSDFQRTGLPEKTARWKLGPKVELRCADVSETGGGNCAIEDVGIRESGAQELRVIGKVRNWSGAGEISRTVKLVAQDRELARSTLTLAPGAARQISFRIPASTTSTLEGRLELEDDSLPIDNRRYFAWQTAGKRRVVLLASSGAGATQPAVRFLSSALPREGDLPWQLEIQPHDQAKDILMNEEKRPGLLIVIEQERLTQEGCEAVRRYIEAGGRALLALDNLTTPSAPSQSLLAALGMRAEGPRYSEKTESRFALVSWADFDHPIFFPLRGPQFNDFSSVRFYNHQRVSVLKSAAKSDAEENPRVLARFEPDAQGRAWPAMLEARLGAGRAAVWAFGLDLEWSNFPRSVKFIPLLHETLSELGSGAENRRTWLVGETLTAPRATDMEKETPKVRLPAEAQEADVGAAGGLRARRAGFVRWRGARDEIVEAVNVHAQESNPERISPEEFQLKLCAPRTEPEAIVTPDLERGIVVAGSIAHREYWRWLVGAMFLFFFIESWNAAAALR